jgi:alpha-beta hydrolase superfamily lysophospholipase
LELARILGWRELHPFQWSGANSELARERAAKALARTVQDLRRKFEAVHIVGHSHGGNVANQALDRLRWGQERSGRRVTRCVTVGTPFLKQRVSTLQVLSAFAFLAIAVAAAPLWASFVLQSLAPQADRTTPLACWWARP